MLIKHRVSRAPYIAVVTTLLGAIINFQLACAHNGGILVQAQAGKLITGLDDESGGQQTLGIRAFTLLFPASLANDIPSFLSLTNAPVGSEPLPVGSKLYWDFLPMTWNGITSNLMYWDGIGMSVNDVEFGLLPQNDIALSLYTQNFTDVAQVDGSPEMVPGKLVGTATNNMIAMHAHRWFYLASQSSVPEGIYMFAMQLRVDGYVNTDPFYILAATDEIAASTLDNIALPWVEKRIDSLIIQGDYDGDQDVDGADFLVWQRQFGSAGNLATLGESADGNYDGRVDAKDLAIWQSHYGRIIPEISKSDLVHVPEPKGIFLLLVCALSVIAVERLASRG